MSISSMTGFARGEGVWKEKDISIDWFFEAKSVNGKSLDIKCKIPAEYENLQGEIKTIIAKYLKRGSVNVCCELNYINDGVKLKVNKTLMLELAQQAIDLYESFGDKLQKPSTTDILAMKGVIEQQKTEWDEDSKQNFEKELLLSLEKVCENLQKDRQVEGLKMQIVLLDILEKINTMVNRIDEIALTLPDRLKEKVRNQVDVLLAEDTHISDERLAQEVVLYVNRADIREEIDRLKAHINTAKEILANEETVGRRLDFLCQEMNREANTTCSKSCDLEITTCGMELKMLIEQFREQIQNME